MSTTVKYNGDTIATFSNQKRALDTAGTRLTADIIIESNDEGGSSATLGTKSITANGTYNASSDNYDGYSSVTVNVASQSASLQSKTNITPTTSSQTITPDSGYDGLSSVQINAMPSGTAGTPTATKGTVSNHSVSVTPSVTNTTGYITGSTINGTAVTVSASELDSGTKSITANGTGIDVVGYAAVDVEVPSGSPSLQAKTNITPTTSSQTITADSGYDGLSSVQINAMPSGSATTPATTITANPSISVNASGLITATSSATQSVIPTVSEGYISSGTAGTVTVSGSNTSQLSTQAGTTITPTESEQTAVAAGKYTAGAVKVGAISSTYVGSDIAQNDSTDLSASGATVTVPAGYYAENASKSVSSGSATTPATTITANPSISVSSSGLITATASASQNITPTVSAGYVSSGTAGTVTVSGSKMQQLTTQGATTYNTSTTDQTISSGTYLTGTQTIKAVQVSGLDASKIASGTTVTIGDANDPDRIASVTGTLSFSTITTSSSSPSGGSNGDIWIQTS